MKLKKSLPREYLWFVNRVLTEYPEDKRELNNIERTIEACCSPQKLPGAAINNDAVSDPVARIVDAKLNNKQYQYLSKRVNKIEKALIALNAKDIDFLNKMYFDGLELWEIAEDMKISERQARAIKIKILRKMTPYVLGDWVKK